MAFSFKLDIGNDSPLAELLKGKKGGGGSGATGGGAPETSIDKTAITNIANPKVVGTANAADVSDEYRGNYTHDDEDKDIAVLQRRDRATDESYTNNPEEWANRFKYWNWNLAKNNYRGNLNGMGFGRTRMRSRLADALNNQRHLKPTDIGRRTLHYGATGTGADNAGSERWEPIETQEMRQMRANEKLDERARGYDIDRQKAIEDYPLEIRKAIDKNAMEINKYAAQTGIDVERVMQKAIITAKYSENWSTFWSELQTQFAQEYGLDISERVFAKMAQIKDYPLKQMYGFFTKGINVPDPLTQDYWNYAQRLVKQAEAQGKSGMEILCLQSLVQVMGALASANGTIAGMKSGFDLAASNMFGIVPQGVTKE